MQLQSCQCGWHASLLNGTCSSRAHLRSMLKLQSMGKLVHQLAETGMKTYQSDIVMEKKFRNCNVGTLEVVSWTDHQNCVAWCPVQMHTCKSESCQNFIQDSQVKTGKKEGKYGISGIRAGTLLSCWGGGRRGNDWNDSGKIGKKFKSSGFSRPHKAFYSSYFSPFPGQKFCSAANALQTQRWPQTTKVTKNSNSCTCILLSLQIRR